MVYVVDLDDTLVLTKNLNNDAYNYALEQNGQRRIETNKETACIEIINYLVGNYLLKNLDSNGQRLAIPVILAGKTFYTGWMLEPEGKIRNTTPFGGWVK